MIRSMVGLMLVKLRMPDHVQRPHAAEDASNSSPEKANDAERLRELLHDIYHSGVLNPLEASDAEHMRLLDVVLAAAEGREFDRLGLPFPRQKAEACGAVATLPALPLGWVYVAMPASEALLDSGPPYGPQ
jgi:hypothetical protein